MTTTLTAWSIKHYGAPEVLNPVTRPIPEPGPNQILIRIHASAVTRADGMMRAGQPLFARPFLGLRRPRQNLSGTGLSGEVIAAGHNVSRFAVGDAVFGEAGLKFGANASHICLDETGVLMKKPATLSHEDAAVMCDGPLTSYHFLHEIAQIQPGQRILILGGSGSLGTAAVQIATAAGANVSATCSTRNVRFVSELGAERVIDYTKEDFTALPDRYNVIYDTLGVSSFARAKARLTDDGRYICPVLTLPLLGAMLRSRMTGGRRAMFTAAGLQPPEILRAHLTQLLAMMEAGTLSPVLDRVYPFADLVEAHRHMETGHKRGNVVIV
ncbi:NAD(P)-dependent alcohol dehydrogenase [Yoonia sp.]|uniref:NAD(P)-dependent alcohol dehydrogenase n=1 Tax=Yoonia sp. TaxID=2212373 RepID=UPI003F6B5359